jgi:ribosomal protein S18 acetylase RimI-like enzyme
VEALAELTHIEASTHLAAELAPRGLPRSSQIGYFGCMENTSAEIISCPPERRIEALSLVLCDLAPSQRRDIIDRLVHESERPPESPRGLFVALRSRQLCGAVWGQLQPGNTAVLWLPQLIPGEPERTAVQLAEASVRELDRVAVSMSQVLLPSGETAHDPVLHAVGFHHLADLVYLSCEAQRCAAEAIECAQLDWVTYDESQRDRLARVIERTYDGTLDCAALNGQRHIEDVIDGYQAAGVFQAENWRIVCSGGADVGVLLLTDHPVAGHLELVYMGVVPEARGQGWGKQIVRHAQDLARRARVERIVLAVDAVNTPALRMYRSAGFEAWDHRAVYVRFNR